MNPSAATQDEPTTIAVMKNPARLHVVLAILTAVFFAVAITALPASAGSPEKLNWPDALLLLLAAAGSVTALARQLPLQNVLSAALVIGLMGGAAHALNASVGMPFGPLVFGADIGPKILKIFPWAMPLLWVVAVFNSRGVARLVLRPWRKIKNYGYWLIGLTALLVALFDLALEPFASHAKHYWLWTPTKFPLEWFGAPLVNFLAWVFVTMLMLAFVTPTLIKKQPGPRSVPDYHPLAVWLGGILLFALATALNRLWPATAVDAAVGIVTAVFAIRGGRW
jgi:uncharacterized membrane protein